MSDPRPSASIRLELVNESEPRLLRCSFDYAPFQNGDVRHSLRGIDREFKWGVGTQSIAAFLLEQASWAQRRDPTNGATPPEFKGYRGSIAGSLNNALSSKWAEIMFGMIGADPVTKYIFDVQNRDFSTDDKAPVVIRLLPSDRGGILHPKNISVCVDNQTCIDSNLLQVLANRVKT